MVREASKRVAEHAPLRRAADRRHGAAPGQDRRDAHRRGQDAGGHAAGRTSTRSTGKGVHVVTVNDYLARRDAEWMGRIYRFLGLTVGVEPSADGPRPRSRPPTRADITYGTNNEFGFDYLRDNMVAQAADRVAARAALRDRRRGRLDPDRRGAHAADHLRPGRGPHRAVRHRRVQLRAVGAQAAHQAEDETGPATSPSTRRRTRCLLTEEGHEHAEEHPRPRPGCSPPGRASTIPPTSR